MGQYHEVRRLCALRDMILNLNPDVSKGEALAVAKERVKRLGMGSVFLFDLDVEDNDRTRPGSR